jgi:hypothetical protein
MEYCMQEAFVPLDTLAQRAKKLFVKTVSTQIKQDKRYVKTVKLDIHVKMESKLHVPKAITAKQEEMLKIAMIHKSVV